MYFLQLHNVHIYLINRTPFHSIESYFSLTQDPLISYFLGSGTTVSLLFNLFNILQISTEQLAIINRTPYVAYL
jgi:hypothetical protein